MDDIVTVTEDEIAAAILALMEKQKLVAEGGGSRVRGRGSFSHKLPIGGKKTACIVSGGNIDVTILSPGDHPRTDHLRPSGLLVRSPCRISRGSFRRSRKFRPAAAANVVSVHHEHADPNMAISSCFLKVNLETRDFDQIDEIHRQLEAHGFRLVQGHI